MIELVSARLVAALALYCNKYFDCFCIETCRFRVTFRSVYCKTIWPFVGLIFLQTVHITFGQSLFSPWGGLSFHWFAPSSWLLGPRWLVDHVRVYKRAICKFGQACDRRHWLRVRTGKVGLCLPKGYLGLPSVSFTHGLMLPSYRDWVWGKSTMWARYVL